MRRAASQPDETKPENINLSIDAEGTVYWIAEPIDPSRLRARIADAAAGKPQPELHLRAERTTQYMGEWHK